MKGIVAYDSVHGNTKQVAEAIAEEIRTEGHQVEIFNLKDARPKVVAGDFMFIGSPTKAGRMTGNVKDFMESLDLEVGGTSQSFSSTRLDRFRRTRRSARNGWNWRTRAGRTLPRKCRSCVKPAV